MQRWSLLLVGLLAAARAADVSQAEMNARLGPDVVVGWAKDLLPTHREVVRTGQEVMAVEYISMRDGVKLYTTWYLPLVGKSFPVVLERSAYTTIYAPVLALKWNSLGFGVVVQDQRGTGLSRDDTFKYWRYDGQDGYDTMEWIASQSWSDGTVFPTGTSAMANSLLAGLLYEPPWVKAGMIRWGSADGHATTYQGGAYRQLLVTNWLSLLLNGYFVDELYENEAFSDYWDPIYLPGKEDLCHVPAIWDVGWYDIFQNENLDAFNLLQYEAPDPACRGKHKLVINPNGHCFGGGYVNWPRSHNTLASTWAEELFLSIAGLEVPESVKKANADADVITMYVMGPHRSSIGNYWTTIPDWPEQTEVSYFLHAGGSLDFVPPSNETSETSYTYDPSDPTPHNGGHELFGACGPQNMRTTERRDDVIIFTSAPVPTNGTFAVNGEMYVELYVSSDQVDTDFAVTLTDVYPDGTSVSVSDGIVRMRWHRDNSQMQLITPGEIYKVTISLWKTCYLYEEGHSVRVVISSSLHPRFQRNPNNGLSIEEGSEGPLVVAVNSVHAGKEHPSRLVLPTVSLDALPNNFSP